MLRRVECLGAGLLLLALATGCQNYRDQLDRAYQYYNAGTYDPALANLEDLETNLGQLNHQERVRYEFIRGMTHYHLSQRDQARHWLALAREDAENTSYLDEQARQLLTRNLAELDSTTPAGRGGAGSDAGTPSSGN